MRAAGRSSRVAALCLLGLLSAAPSRTASSVVSDLPPLPSSLRLRARADRCACRWRTASPPCSPTTRGSPSRPSPAVARGSAPSPRRLCGDARRRRQGGRGERRPTTLQVTARYSIPFDLLSPEWQLKAAARPVPGRPRGGRRLAPQGARRRAVAAREPVAALADWFTGTGENFRAIREYNELMDDDVPRGTAVLDPLRAAAPGLPRRAAGAREALPARVRHGQGRRVRHLPPAPRRGALLARSSSASPAASSPADVNALAAKIAKRSGIAGRHRHPDRLPGQDPVRRCCSPSSCPRGTRSARSTRRACAPSARFSNQVKASGLAGITVILDAGHGGQRRRAPPWAASGRASTSTTSRCGSRSCWRPRRPPGCWSPRATASDFRVHGRRRPPLLARPRGADHAARIRSRTPRWGSTCAGTSPTASTGKVTRTDKRPREGGLPVDPRRLAPPVAARR